MAAVMKSPMEREKKKKTTLETVELEALEQERRSNNQFRT